MINEMKVFSPANITGFFEIINNENKFMKGSKGAGITLDKGVTTHTKLIEGEGNINIFLNGEKNNKNSISKRTIDVICMQYNLDLSDYDLIINHETVLPISSGFGTSAGFAIGVSYTLPKMFGIDLTFKEAGDIAHFAEVSESTGLGDVISSIYGGCVLRLKEGSPTNGIIDKIPTSPYIYVISKTLSKLDTKEIINNPIQINKINSSGKTLMKELLKNPNINNFMKLSRKFSEKTGLINNELKEILNIFDDENGNSSMAMLGNTAFTISDSPDTSIKNCLITKINKKGVEYKI